MNRHNINRHNGNDDHLPIKALSTFLQGLKRKSNTDEAHTPPRRFNETPHFNNRNQISPQIKGAWNPAPRTRCEVCNITCSSESNLAQHKLGKKHLIALGEVEEDNVVPPAERAKKVLNAMGDSQPFIHMTRVSDSGVCQFKCELCPGVFMFESDIILHVKGRKHQEGLEERLGFQSPPQRKPVVKMEHRSHSPRKVADKASRRDSENYKAEQKTKMELDKFQASLDERKKSLDAREEKLALQERKYKEKAEALSKREADIKLKEVKMLSSSYNATSTTKNNLLLEKLHEIVEAGEGEISSKLSQSEQRYYSQLISQKKEVEVAYNNITKKQFLTMEERLAKSKLKVALEDIQASLTNLLKNKNIKVPKHLSTNLLTSPRVSSADPNRKSNMTVKSPAIKTPDAYENVSKDDLKKQMEQKLLEAMKGGTLGKLAKVIAQNPSMKATLEKLEKKHGADVEANTNTPSQIEDPKTEERKPDNGPSHEEIHEAEQRRLEKLHREFPAQKKPLLGNRPPLIKTTPSIQRRPSREYEHEYEHAEYYEEEKYPYEEEKHYEEEYYEKPHPTQYRRSAPVVRYEGLLPRPRHSAPLLPVPAPVPAVEKRRFLKPDVKRHGVRPHPSQIGVIPAPKRKRPLIGEAPGYPSYY